MREIVETTLLPASAISSSPAYPHGLMDVDSDVRMINLIFCFLCSATICSYVTIQTDGHYPVFVFVFYILLLQLMFPCVPHSYRKGRSK